jgi:hypothetical protein
LSDEKVLATLSTSEKERLLGRVSIAKGIVFDKLRLHEGKDTNKFAHEIQVTHVHQNLDFRPPSAKVVEGTVRAVEKEGQPNVYGSPL